MSFFSQAEAAEDWKTPPLERTLIHYRDRLVEVSPHDIRVLQGFVEGYNLQSIFMKACVAYSDRHFLPSRRHRWVTNEVDKEKFFPNGFLKASEFTKALCTVGSLPEFKPEKYWLLYIRASDVVVSHWFFLILTSGK